MTMESKAYVVSEEYEGTCAIVFANSSAAARREGAAQLNMTFEEVDSCRRAQWADGFSKDGKIPIEAALDNGFWVECDHCGERLDYLRDEGFAVPVGTFGGHAYCTPACEHAEAISRADRRLCEAFGREVIKHKLRTMYGGQLSPCLYGGIFSPYVYVSRDSGDLQIFELGLDFKFTGGKYDGRLRYKRCEEPDPWHATIARGDLDAWEQFIALQKAA